MDVTVASSGTGGGFERFCSGETQISDASRPIKEDEIAACKEAGVEFIELPVALDGLAVMTNPETEFVDCLTMADLKKIWQPSAEGKVTNWNQVRKNFPDQEMALFGPGEQSGTFDFFTDGSMARKVQAVGLYGGERGRQRTRSGYLRRGKLTRLLRLCILREPGGPEAARCGRWRWEVCEALEDGQRRYVPA